MSVLPVLTRLHGYALRSVAVLAVAALGAACTTTPTEITLDGVMLEGGGLAPAQAAGLVQVVRGAETIGNRTRMVLRPGDQIITGPTAYAVIRYPSGTELFMRPNSRGRVGSFSELVGEVFAKIRGAFAVQSDFVRAGAEGTAYLVRAQPSGETTVVVFDGQVNLSSLNNAWAPVRLPAGEMAMTRPRAPPARMAAPADELLRTRGWVERLEKGVPAQRQYSVGKTASALAIGGLIAIIIGRQADRDEPPKPHEAPPRGRSYPGERVPASPR